MAAFNLDTGTLDSNFAPNPNSDVNAMLFYNNTVFIGGGFNALDGAHPQIGRLARINADGILDRSFAPNPNNRVRALALNGDTLYVGGSFSVIADKNADKLAAISTKDGSLRESWKPNPDNDIYVLAHANNKLYVAGDFANIGGRKIGFFARISDSNTDGSADDWNPNFNDLPNAFAVNGDTLYAGGYFTVGDGCCLAKINTTDNSLPTAMPVVPITGSTIESIAIANNVLYVGGQFSGIVGSNVALNNLAAFYVGPEPSTYGAFYDKWLPNPIFKNDPFSRVDALAATSSRVYLGGEFDSVVGADRTGIAAVNAVADVNTTAAIDNNWIPISSDPYPTIYVMHAAGDSIFIGGGFNIGTQEDFAETDLNGALK